jgi:hypothetical protein
MQIAACDLDVPILGQLTPAQFSFGHSLEARSLQVVRFDTTLGRGGIGQQALEHTPKYPHHAVVFANFNAELDSLRLGIPSSVIGKGEEHRRVRWSGSRWTMFSIRSAPAKQRRQ